jgi:hypothetical protein
MVNFAVVKVRESLIPLVAVVISGTWLKLVSEAATREPLGELAIRCHQALLYAA